LKSGRDALRELAVAVASEPELRLAVINAVLADVATKHDINQLREEMRREMGQFRRDMNNNFMWTVGLIVAIWGDHGHTITDEDSWHRLDGLDLTFCGLRSPRRFCWRWFMGLGCYGGFIWGVFLGFSGFLVGFSRFWSLPRIDGSLLVVFGCLGCVIGKCPIIVRAV
jgi:hypothetical protein